MQLRGWVLRLVKGIKMGGGMILREGIPTNHTTDPTDNHVEEFFVFGVFRLDEDGGGGDDCGDGFQTRRAHGIAALDEVDDAIHARYCAGGFHAAVQMLDVGFDRVKALDAVRRVDVLGIVNASFQPSEILLREPFERSCNSFVNEVFGRGDAYGGLRDLNL